jgi:hypothetical protein
MFLQPVRDGGRLAVAEQVNGPAGLGVDEDGAVVPAAAEREIVNLSGVRTKFRRVFAGSDGADASVAWSGGADAVLLEQAAEPEKLAMGGGELFLELADRGPPRVAFLAEP